jgi:hypothetical protein
MDKMIEHLREIARAIGLETAYHWELPANLPIEIPVDVIGAFSRNVYLKEHLAPVLENDFDLSVHYWIIREWGSIRTFKVGDRNDKVIRNFKEEVRRGKLTRTSFASISSLSKLSSFWEPERYAIYDSRAVFSLNWLIFRHSKNKQLFPQPVGRNTAVSKYDTRTLFALSGTDHQYRSHKTAYHDYCGFLRDLSMEIYGKHKPYFVEMLLFLAAPEKIIEDIEASVKVIIN